MTIDRPKVKQCGPNCHCPACNAEWAEYWSEQREIDEQVHRDRLIREHVPATDREWRDYLNTWAWGFGDEPPTVFDVVLDREGAAR